MIFQFNNIEKQLYPTTTKHLIAKRKMNNRNNFDLWATRQPSTRGGRQRGGAAAKPAEHALCKERRRVPQWRALSPFENARRRSREAACRRDGRAFPAPRRIRNGPRVVLDTEVDNILANRLAIPEEERVQHLNDMFRIAVKTEELCAEIPKAVKQRKLRMIIEKENRICHFKNLAMVMKGKGMDSLFTVSPFSFD